MNLPATGTSHSRLNLGCGFDHRPGYLNVDFQDFHQPDLKADVRDLSMLDSDTCEEVLAVDVLEHLERGDVLPALQEWSRVLAPGGSLHLRTTDVIGLANLMLRRETVADHHQLIQGLFGTQAYKGDYHLAGFTDLTLMDHLFEAGFDRIRIARHHGWLLVADARQAQQSSAADLIALGLDQGFHEVESDGSSTWRSCQAIAGVLLFNRHGEQMRVRLELTVSRPDREVQVELHGPGLTEQATVRDRVTLSYELQLASGPNHISLISHGPPIDARDDPRNLHLRIHELAFAPAW